MENNKRIVYLKKSNRKDKKWEVYIPSLGKTINFGSKGSSDYTIHKDGERRQKYLIRHAGVKPNFQKSTREDWTIDGIGTAGFWSRWLTWEKPNLGEAYQNLDSQFDILVYDQLNNLNTQKAGWYDDEAELEKLKKGVYVPQKYVEGLTTKEQIKRVKRIREGTKSDSKDPYAYRPFETDFRDGRRIKTKLSNYTKQWRKYYPEATSLEDKSNLTGVPLEILEKVGLRGNAAWRTGHRTGANQHQWGHARVNSFLVKGKTFYTADHKLAKEAIQHNKAKKWFQSIDGLCDPPNPKNWCREDVIGFPKE